MRNITLCLSLLLSACAQSQGAGDASVQNTADVVQSPTCQATSEVIRFNTEDGVELVADLDVPQDIRGAVVLLHMIPPSNNRSNYPLEFRQALQAQGLMVLNVDRRGAGESGGIALEAYEGTQGVLDAEAAVSMLESTGCVNAADIALVGASNGTTTVFDYVVKSDTAPKALVFLSGGPYTENQNTMNEHKAKLSMPTLIVWDAEEARVDEWAEALRPDAPASFVFDQRSPGGHGTIMFQNAPSSVQDVSDFIGAAFD